MRLSSRNLTLLALFLTVYAFIQGNVRLSQDLSSQELEEHWVGLRQASLHVKDRSSRNFVKQERLARKLPPARGPKPIEDWLESFEEGVVSRAGVVGRNHAEIDTEPDDEAVVNQRVIEDLAKLEVEDEQREGFQAQELANSGEVTQQAVNGLTEALNARSVPLRGEKILLNDDKSGSEIATSGKQELGAQQVDQDPAFQLTHTAGVRSEIKTSSSLLSTIPSATGQEGSQFEALHKQQAGNTSSGGPESDEPLAASTTGRLPSESEQRTELDKAPLAIGIRQAEGGKVEPVTALTEEVEDTHITSNISATTSPVIAAMPGSLALTLDQNKGLVQEPISSGQEQPKWGRCNRIKEPLGKLAVGDGTCDGDPQGAEAQDPCRPHGFCREGMCVCAAAYTGMRCNLTNTFPAGMRGDFEGRLVLGQNHVLEKGGVFFKANPKAGIHMDGSGQVRYLFAPLTNSTQADEHMTRELIAGNLINADGGAADSPTIMTAGLLKRLPEDDVLKGTLFERCAIVGSSGLNLVYEQGEEIDSHDAVFRFNSAPTFPNSSLSPLGAQIEWSKHVGKRTTFRLVNTQHIEAVEGKEIRLQQLQTKSGLLNYIQHVELNPTAQLFAFDTDFTGFVSSNIKVLPTGGFFGIMMALQACAHVNLYGFHWRPSMGIPHHYFNDETPLTGEKTIHDYDQENSKVKALAQAGLIHFAQPCVAECEAETGIPCTSCPHGSTCACGVAPPIPMALPGYCHLARNFTCFYECSGGSCRGGPEDSRCPGGFDPAGATCATEVSSSWKDDPPAWTQKGYAETAEGNELRQAAEVDANVVSSASALPIMDLQRKLEERRAAEAQLHEQQLVELQDLMHEAEALRGHAVKQKKRKKPASSIVRVDSQSESTVVQGSVLDHSNEGLQAKVTIVDQ